MWEVRVALHLQRVTFILWRSSVRGDTPPSTLADTVSPSSHEDAIVVSGNLEKSQALGFHFSERMQVQDLQKPFFYGFPIVIPGRLPQQDSNWYQYV